MNEGEFILKDQEVNSKIEIEVTDNGVGLPTNFSEKKRDSLGIYLIYALVEQLGGEMVVESKKHGREGSSFLIRFDKPNQI